jgi:Zn-finger nucleic acid-binding protein
MHFQEGHESLTCDYCNSVYLPERNEDGIRVLDEPSDLHCPVCQVPLVFASLEHQRFLYCTHCRGSLIPMAAFVLLVKDLRAHHGPVTELPRAPDPGELNRARRCPQCDAAMDTHYYAGGGNVVIDDCSRCELNWLDAGELMTIARAPDHSFDEQPPTWAEEEEKETGDTKV